MGEQVDERTDIYSLGCVLYESLAGKPPFSHPLETQVMQLHQRASIPDVLAARPGIPRAVGIVIERALSKKPADRWQTADAMRVALRHAAGT